MNASEVERLLWFMPTIAARATNAWAKEFAKSVIRQSRRKGWRPSRKQADVMRNLVSDLYAHGYEGTEAADLIES